jgi:hypothetical protein
MKRISEPGRSMPHDKTLPRHHGFTVNNPFFLIGRLRSILAPFGGLKSA